jgi:hypothetical protein
VIPPLAEYADCLLLACGLMAELPPYDQCKLWEDCGWQIFKAADFQTLLGGVRRVGQLVIPHIIHSGETAVAALLLAFPEPTLVAMEGNIPTRARKIYDQYASPDDARQIDWILSRIYVRPIT